MVGSQTARLPRSFWRVLALTLSWESLPSGVYFLFGGNLGWGVLLTLAGLACMVVGLSGATLHWAESRVVFRPLGTLMVVSLILLIPAEIWIAIGTGRYDPQAQLPMFIHLLVYLGLVILTVWWYRKSVAAEAAP